MGILKRINSRIILLVASLILIPLFYARCFAQSQETSEKVRNNGEDVVCVLKFTTVMVLVEVDVKDHRGQVVTDLSHKDFIVIEDGVRQEVVFLRAQDKKDENQEGFQYKLGFEPINDNFDGKFRRVRVAIQANADRKFTVRTRFKSLTKGKDGNELITYFGYYAVDPEKEIGRLK